MLIREALEIINGGRHIPQVGFMVRFEFEENGYTTSDYFPNQHIGEPLISTERKAWELAKRFADATTGTYRNIFVVDQNYSPVEGFRERMIVNEPNMNFYP
jgi:hypothetical protein